MNCYYSDAAALALSLAFAERLGEKRRPLRRSLLYHYSTLYFFHSVMILPLVLVLTLISVRGEERASC